MRPAVPEDEVVLDIIPTPHNKQAEHHHPRKMMLRVVAFTLALTAAVGVAASVISQADYQAAKSAEWELFDIGNDRCNDGWLFSEQTAGDAECRELCAQDAACTIYNLWETGWCQGHKSCEDTSPDPKYPDGSISTYQFTGTKEVTATELDSAPGTCDLCNDQNWVFIFGTGRSGSTSVLAMLNAIPGFYMAGENNGQLLHLMEAFEDSQFVIKDRANSLPFYHGEINSNELLCDIQKYTLDMIGDYDKETTKAIGFKEIKILTKEHFEFMKQAFPCAKFILNWREDVEAQHESTFRENTSVEELESMNKAVNDWGDANPDITYKLPCCGEGFSVENFNGMLPWLGITGCSYNGVAHANDDGYSSAKDQVEFAAFVDGECVWDSTTTTPSLTKQELAAEVVV
jgi:hypothetical protein